MRNSYDGAGLESGLRISQHHTKRFVMGERGMSFAFGNELFVEKIKNTCNMAAFAVS